MNWLAHILLSKRNVEYQLGNLLADPFKGKLWTGASQSIRDGVEMHQAIDMFTDGHEHFAQCKARLGNNGYLKGVVLDLLFDHFLSHNWDRYSPLNLPQFIDQFYRQARDAMRIYPDAQRQFIEKVINADLLLSYYDFEGFILALERIDRRLSDRVKRKDTATRYLPIVEQQYEALKADFEAFFPALIAFFKNHQLGDVDDHFFYAHQQ